MTNSFSKIPAIMSSETESTAPDTVVFDVGGTVFKVSRSLIEESETMLSRLVSETWQGDPSKPVFIDRNGSTFEFVLDYLRYGSVQLPQNLPKSNFIREMDFYGISIDDAHINQDSSVQELERLKQNVADAELKHDMFILAVHAYHQFMTGSTAFFMDEDDDIGLKRRPSAYVNDSEDASEVLASYLKEYYGLKAYDIIFSKTTGMSVKVSKLGANVAEEALYGRYIIANYFESLSINLHFSCFCFLIKASGSCHLQN